MSVADAVRFWNRFFFEARDPTPLGLFRILYGLLTISNLILLHHSWLDWFGVHSWTTLDTIRKLEPGPRLNLFELIPQNDGSIQLFFWIFLFAAVLLTLGAFTRITSVVVFLCVISIQQRNLFSTNSGDTFMRVAGFFLMFAPAGAALSIDRLSRIWRGYDGLEVRPRPPWAQRMIQIEMSLLYVTAAWSKSMGANWVNGTSLYYIYHLDQFHRFPVPLWVQFAALVKAGTWLTLVIELSLGVLVWFKELRHFVLLMGVVFHLAIEYSLNIPLFEWILISTYVLFLSPADLKWIKNHIARIFRFAFREPVTVTYDGSLIRIGRAVRTLQAIDIFHQVRFLDIQTGAAESGIAVQVHNGLSVATRKGVRTGFGALPAIARAMPLQWPLAVPALLVSVPLTRQTR